MQSSSTQAQYDHATIRTMNTTGIQYKTLWQPRLTLREPDGAMIEQHATSHCTMRRCYCRVAPGRCVRQNGQRIRVIVVRWYRLPPARGWGAGRCVSLDSMRGNLGQRHPFFTSCHDVRGKLQSLFSLFFFVFLLNPVSDQWQDFSKSLTYIVFGLSVIVNS